jgi:hypothetical protein
MPTREDTAKIFIERLTQETKKKYGGIPSAKNFQKPLYEALEISQQRVSSWFQGTLPRGDQIVNLARLFKVTTDYLLGLSDEEKPKTISISEIPGLVKFKPKSIDPDDLMPIPMILIKEGKATNHDKDQIIIHKRVFGRRRNFISVRVERDGTTSTMIFGE